MAAGDQKDIDEATTLALIKAFKQALDDQQAAASTVTATQSNLAGSWTGVASGKFGDGLTQWLTGLNKVHQALGMIDESMVKFSKLTANTEDDNLALAAQHTLNTTGPTWT